MSQKTQHTPGPWTCKPLLTPDDESDPQGVYIVEPVATNLQKAWDNAPFCVDSTPELDAIHAENQANAALIAAAPELLQALQLAAALIPTARKHFPKSIRNSDKFDLENSCATINTAIAKAGGAE